MEKKGNSNKKRKWYIINFVKLIKEFGERNIDTTKLESLVKDKIKTQHIDTFLGTRMERRKFVHNRVNRKLDFWMYIVSQMTEVFDENII